MSTPGITHEGSGGFTPTRGRKSSAGLSMKLVPLTEKDDIEDMAAHKVEETAGHNTWLRN